MPGYAIRHALALDWFSAKGPGWADTHQRIDLWVERQGVQVSIDVPDAQCHRDGEDAVRQDLCPK